MKMLFAFLPFSGGDNDLACHRMEYYHGVWYEKKNRTFNPLMVHVPFLEQRFCEYKVFLVISDFLLKTPRYLIIKNALKLNRYFKNIDPVHISLLFCLLLRIYLGEFIGERWLAKSWKSCIFCRSDCILEYISTCLLELPDKSCLESFDSFCTNLFKLDFRSPLKCF